MQQTTADQQLVLTLLRELLSQRCEHTPQIELQRYAFALRSLIYACPRQNRSHFKDDAYYVLVEAMHQIYCKKETDPSPWICLVEETTYDAFRRLQTLSS
ncbi:MAG: hypothetical protein E7319_05540 [Clostridiales bacterium]|nr:hypothetical protein [Clostridiales bacterium]